MRTRQQRGRFKDVAVDQAERSRVFNAANSVKEQRTVHAVDREACLRRTVAAHRELGAKIVGRGNAGQQVRGTIGIVGDQSAEPEQLAAAED
jgi:hypothetical protein